MDISYTLMGKYCPMTADPPCKPKKYRSISGYCNNVQNPRWGNSYTKYSRLLPPAYEDGVSLPRGGHLPSARQVSLGVHTDKDVKHDHLAALAVIWGQFVAHDIGHTPLAASKCFVEKHEPLGDHNITRINNFRSEWFTIKMLWSEFLRISSRMLSN